MNRSGITVNSELVVAGAFAFVGTHGLPLDFLLHVLKTHGMVVDWLDFIQDARRDGWKDRTIRARILAAVADVFGPVYLKDFDDTFSKIIS